MNSIYLLSNIEKIEDYQYYFGPDINTLCKMCFTNENMKIANKKLWNNPERNARLLITNIIDINYLLNLETLSRKEHAVNFKKIPFYLYYETYEIFLPLITKNDITPLLQSNRVVFLIGETYLKEYFKDLQTVLPSDIYGYNYCHTEEIIEEIACKREKQLEQIHKEIVEYYEKNDKKIVNNILSGNPKILFIKCRFSYVIKNHTRDCCKAFKRLGYETVVSEETADINRIYREEDINKHKPDIIFDIDHVRYNYDFLMPNVVYISWIQDPEPRLFNSEIPKKLTKRDVVLNYFVAFDDVYNKYGFNKADLLNAPIPGNELIYKKYSLSSEEKEKYSCDICYVSNFNNYIKLMNELMKKYEKDIQDSIKKFVDWYFKKEDTNIFLNGYSPNLIYEYFENFLDDNISLSQLDIENLKNDFMKIQYSMKKYITARWLIKNKNYNVSLWGNDWDEIEEFKPYSKGLAQNGEALSKIYNASKICIGTHPQTTSSARVFEILLSSSLCMAEDINKQYDILPFDLISNEDTNGIVFYSTKEEFYEKLDYYLSNEEERKKVSEYGYKQAQEKFTYLTLIKNTISYMNDRLKSE